MINLLPFELIGVVVATSGACWLLFRHYVADLKTEFHEVIVGLHERVECLEAKAKSDADKAETLIKASFAATKNELGKAKDEIKAHLEEHKNDLKEQADRLRAHAQQMHDETRTRVTARVVPTRG